MASPIFKRFLRWFVHRLCRHSSKPLALLYDLYMIGLPNFRCYLLVHCCLIVIYGREFVEAHIARDCHRKTSPGKSGKCMAPVPSQGQSHCTASLGPCLATHKSEGKRYSAFRLFEVEKLWTSSEVSYGSEVSSPCHFPRPRAGKLCFGGACKNGIHVFLAAGCSLEHPSGNIRS